MGLWATPPFFPLQYKIELVNTLDLAQLSSARESNGRKTGQGRSNRIMKKKRKAPDDILLKKKKKRLSFSYLSEQHNVLCVGIHVFQRNRTNTREKVGGEGRWDFFSYCGNQLQRLWNLKVLQCVAGICQSRKPNVSLRAQGPENMELHLRAKQPYPSSRRQ